MIFSFYNVMLTNNKIYYFCAQYTIYKALKFFVHHCMLFVKEKFDS